MKRQVPRLQGRAKDIAKGELVGQQARVVRANDAGIVGLQGAIVDETLHTLSLRVGKRRLQLAKVGMVIEVDGVEIDGAAMEYRSWDRTKKVR